jgi:hypothetical protein
MREIVAEQRTQEWFKARIGKVTGSTLERALNPKKQDTFMYELIAGMMVEHVDNELNVDAVIRGRDLEPFAVAQAVKDLGVKFVDAGFCVSDLIDGFGLSPDNVQYGKRKIIGGLEVKCPNTATHVKYIIGNEVPKEHKYQVVAPFIASDDVKFWTFMSYDDRCYERPTFYKSVIRDDVEDMIGMTINKARETLIKFIGRVNDKHTSLTF